MLGSTQILLLIGSGYAPIQGTRMLEWNTEFTMQLIKRKLRVLPAKLLSRQANPLTFHTRLLHAG